VGTIFNQDHPVIVAKAFDFAKGLRESKIVNYSQRLRERSFSLNIVYIGAAIAIDSIEFHFEAVSHQRVHCSRYWSLAMIIELASGLGGGIQGH
jgi:hypothetical protein